MSKPTIFTNPRHNNGVLIEDAYKFESFSNYLNNGIKRKFIPKCIFCNSLDTTSLEKEGIFRQCNKCKKQFKSLFS